MRKALYAIALFAVASCTLETSDNGDLDGFWQLQQVDSLTKGSTSDMREAKVFWAVQKDMMRIEKYDYSAIFFRFANTGDSLLLSDPYTDNRDKSDVKVTDVEHLRPLGVNHLREGYAILLLESGKMTLQTDSLRLHFRKY